MKKLIFIFCLTLGILQLSAQGNVFSYTITENSITKNVENTKAFDVNRVLLNQIISKNSNDFLFKIPLIDEGFLNVNMKQFSVLNPEHNLIIETTKGKVKEGYVPDFQSYYILHEGESIGTFLCFENSIVISYKYNNRQFEINKIDNEFLLFDVNDCLLENTFSCKVEEKIEQINNEEIFPESSVMTPKCLELAIEIDHYTRNAFSTNVSTTNWAHAILAGVSQVYFNEVNLNITIVTTIIWETTDPYAAYVNDASNMLGALRNHWTSNNSSISRDLVHLLTKRSNTGTGGIAYVDVLCNNSWGYGFSASLNNTTNFNFPNPPYTWNLMVCSHEIGHNIGSNHTHWCGWPGGAIDNCTNVEGSCPNNPLAQVGTIMSYCHTTASGSLIDFHSIVVSNALTPEINGASCLTLCAFYGCTDPNATNYDPNATVDDGSCLYSPPVLTAIITTITCNGLSNGSIDLSVSGGLLPYTYSWSNGPFSQDLYNISAGTYSLTVTDALGQVQTASYTVSEPAIVSTSYTSVSTSAPGLSDGAIYTTTTGGVLPYSYYWVSPYAITQNLLNIGAGTYTFYAIDANSCFSTSIIVVQDGAIVSGCTDSTALNYNPLANNDDGSCTYTPSSCTNPSPTNAYISELIHDRARVNWDNMNDADCMVDQYRIRYREVGSSTWLSKTMAGSGLCVFGLNTTSKKILGLSASTTYEYYMKAWYCGAGVSAWSAIQNFTTLDLCPNVINFSVSTPTTTKASFTWSTTAAYSFVRIKLRPDITGGVWTTAGGFGVVYPALSKDKNGLVPGQTYRASARTWCDPAGGTYRADSWTAPIFWTQPSAIRIEGGNSINNLAIYPNPSKDIFNISFTSDTKQDLKVRIMNVIGEEVINDNLEQFIGEYTKQINLSDNAKGVYFLEITTNDGVVNKKLILQ